MKHLSASRQKDIIDNFVHKLGGRATITNEMHRTPVMPQYKPFTTPYDFTQEYTIQYKTEPMIRIELPLESFHKLAEEHHNIQDLRARFGPNVDRMGEEIVAREWQDARERRIRASTPAVQKAWDNYRLLLKIAGEDQ